ncbi:hypothetical protein ABZ805_26830 [Saccharopolyspora sp. NPDC047091]|uniref:hypothetical protein n=1 Tax=Saccharopolyspora sp. NPDC047091 TaxID=3155924 RepID=UPI0033E42396
MQPTRLGEVRVLARFDRAAGQVAESIALGPDGSAAIGMIRARQVVRVAQDGTTRTLVSMPTPPGGGTTPVVGSSAVTGVARAADGTLHFLYSGGRGGMTGIWRLDGEPRLVVELPADSMPNALVADGDRFLVTDSTGGRIWQAPVGGGAAAVWSADPALAPDGFFGANGLKVHDGAVWASNSDHGTLLRIPVTADGGAGTAEVRAEGLAGVDDFDFTGRGDEVLAAINLAGELVRIAPDGSRETLLDGMRGTTAVVVRDDHAYVTNGANHAETGSNLLIAELLRG